MSTADVVAAVVVGVLFAPIFFLIFKHASNVSRTCKELERKGWRYSGACNLFLGPQMLPPRTETKAQSPDGEGVVMESDGTERKPRLFLQNGYWRCLYMHEGASSLHSWKGLGRTPTEAYQSMVGMMGEKARLLPSSEVA